MRATEILNEAYSNSEVSKIADTFRSLSTDDQVKIVSGMSYSNLITAWLKIEDFDEWDEFGPEVARVATEIENNERQRRKGEAKRLVPHDKIWYRGTRSTAHGLETRGDYATFLTDNIYQAATYAGPDGIITSVKLTLPNVTEFNKPGDSFNQFGKFDDDARKLPRQSGILVYGVRDRGPFPDIVDRNKALRSDTQNVGLRNPDASVYTITSVDKVIDINELLK